MATSEADGREIMDMALKDLAENNKISQQQFEKFIQSNQ